MMRKNTFRFSVERFGIVNVSSTIIQKRQFLHCLFLFIIYNSLSLFTVIIKNICRSLYVKLGNLIKAYLVFVQIIDIGIYCPPKAVLKVYSCSFFIKIFTQRAILYSKNEKNLLIFGKLDLFS